MKSASRNNKPGHVTKGDIFDDLGFSPAETLEMKIKAEIWQALLQHIEQHGFSQAYLVTTLKAHQPDVSNLLRGKISKISITKLIQFAGRLNLDARVQVTSPKPAKGIASLKASTARTSRSKRKLVHA
jgi:predicted XRE-type DNA-binding protein